MLGANKGMKFIQAASDSNRIIPALVLDGMRREKNIYISFTAKIGQFFKSQSLIATVCEFMRWPLDGFQPFNFEQDPCFPGRMNKQWKAVNDYIKGIG